MGLAEEIQNTQIDLYGRQGAICTMAKLLAALEPEDREALEGLMRNTSIQGTRIAALLNSWAPTLRAEMDKNKKSKNAESVSLIHLCETMTGQTVQRHRSDKCRCVRRV